MISDNKETQQANLRSCSSDSSADVKVSQTSNSKSDFSSPQPESETGSSRRVKSVSQKRKKGKDKEGQGGSSSSDHHLESSIREGRIRDGPLRGDPPLAEAVRQRPPSSSIQPTQDDILFGSDQKNHPGNAKFHLLIDHLQDQYETADRDGRVKVSLIAVFSMKGTGSRFLVLDPISMVWEEMSDAKARRKVTKVIRNRRRYNKNKNKRKNQKSPSGSQSRRQESTGSQSTSSNNR
eukprot:scaffold414_cov109-Cylindrotheca_fusiformis.AAC.11